MMKVTIHYEHLDGTEDSLSFLADTVEQARDVAARELSKRGGVNPWSEIDAPEPQRLTRGERGK